MSHSPLVLSSTRTVQPGPVWPSVAGASQTAAPTRVASPTTPARGPFNASLDAGFNADCMLASLSTGYGVSVIAGNEPLSGLLSDILSRCRRLWKQPQGCLANLQVMAGWLFLHRKEGPCAPQAEPPPL